jgi:hypothetical protein
MLKKKGCGKGASKNHTLHFHTMMVTVIYNAMLLILAVTAIAMDPFAACLLAVCISCNSLQRITLGCAAIGLLHGLLTRASNK